VGLLFGSFINVVVYRLPIMMEIAWRKETNTPSDSGIEVPGHVDQDRFSLWRPASACPHCNSSIGAHENVPVLSYLVLGGRCRSCREPISMRYPLVEAFVGLASAVVAWRFGYSWPCLAALGLTWTLIAASLIDIDYYLLPDSLTLPLLWAGLLIAAIPAAGAQPFADLHSAVIGAAAGYLSLWSVATVFLLLTGKEGMGHGDFKLLGALGAWLGWQMLPLIITLSAGVGAVIGIAAITATRRSRQQPLPFGPYLATAGWIALLWGEDLVERYLDLIL
jgi:leader peptidase (prepilin peptidase)/N-methyltransferase